MTFFVMCVTFANVCLSILGFGVAAIMMFSRDDFQIESFEDLITFLPILVFLGLVAPFLIAAYTLGFVMDVTGWLKTQS